MLTILNLFGKSPFLPLQAHMEKVAASIELLPELFTKIGENKYGEVEKIAALISEREKEADQAKNEIRGHLPTSLFLPMIDRAQLLEILSIQDNMADNAEDIGLLATLKPLTLPKGIEHEFDFFLKKNLEAYFKARKLIQELGQLFESSFGGAEAKKVEHMIDEVLVLEEEVDQAQKKLLIAFYQKENELTFVTFHLWQQIFTHLSALSNLSEKLALRLRIVLELKKG